MISNDFRKYIYALGGLLVLAYLVKVAMESGDFKVYLEAAKYIEAKKSPYNVWFFVSEGNYNLYLYSPLWASILIPFSHLPDFISNLVWLLANVYFIYRIWDLLSKYIDTNGLSKNQLKWIFILTFVMSIRFILYNFDMIQMTIFLLWGCLESLRLIKEKHFLIGGILLALIINIKILPVVLIPYLLYRGFYKGVMIAFLFGVFFLFLPSFVVGWSNNLLLLSDWWGVINPNNAEHLMESDLGPHSLTALIPSLITETDGALPYKRNMLNLNTTTTIYILNSVRLLLIILTIYFLKWPPFTTAKSKLNELREIGFILLLIPLIFPHQQKYAFVLAMPAIYYLIHFVIFNYNSRKLTMTKATWIIIISSIAFSFILMTLSTDGLSGRDLNRITQYYRTITWGALILILALVLSSPSITNKTNELRLTKTKN